MLANGPFYAWEGSNLVFFSAASVAGRTGCCILCCRAQLLLGTIARQVSLLLHG